MQQRHLWAVLVGLAVAVAVWLARPRPAGEPLPVERPPLPEKQDKRRHDELAKKIEAARHEREAKAGDVGRGGGGSTGSGAGGGAGSGSGSAAGHGPKSGSDSQTLDGDYIRGRIVELKPLLKECYELALRERPTLSGKLVLEFEIAGEPTLGGVVTSMEVVRESDAGVQDASLEECVRATIETQTFVAPEQGGTVKVRYPFVFATGKDK